MKRSVCSILLILLLILPFSNASAEWDTFTGTEFTISRLPSPRAQALGKLSASIADDPLLMATHPAVLGFQNSAGISFSHSQPYGINWYDEARPTESYFAWVPIDSRGFSKMTFGAAYNRTDLGEQSLTDEMGVLLGKENTYEELASFSMAGMWDERTSIGASFGYRANHFVGRSEEQSRKVIVGDALTVTVSAIHRIPYRVGIVRGNLQFGATAINLNQPKIIYEDPNKGDQMPLLFRAGPGVVMCVDELGLEVGLYTELQKVYQSWERSGYKYGTEITLHDIVTIRFGYFSENINPNEYEYDALEQTTWGGGVRLPVEWIFPDFPLNIRFDVIESDQDLFSDTVYDFLDPYTLYSISLGLRR